MFTYRSSDEINARRTYNRLLVGGMMGSGGSGGRGTKRKGRDDEFDSPAIRQRGQESFIETFAASIIQNDNLSAPGYDGLKENIQSARDKAVRILSGMNEQRLERLMETLDLGEPESKEGKEGGSEDVLKTFDKVFKQFLTETMVNLVPHKDLYSAISANLGKIFTAHGNREAPLQRVLEVMLFLNILISEMGIDES